MGTRREAREWVVQILFNIDVNPGELDVIFKHFWAERQAEPSSKQFTEATVRGVVDKKAEVDEVIKKYAKHWDIKRMGIIERNTMRMAIYEMIYVKEVPPVVSINEAIDIAKYFSNTEAGRFVNGILDRFRKDLTRPARKAEQPKAE